MRLALPVRVQCRETATYEWVEFTRLLDVTPFGARLALAHLTEYGRLLNLTMPMPRPLRCFDHAEDQYRVWALVRSVSRSRDSAARSGGAAQTPGDLRFEVGVAFIGKRPPASYLKEPTTRYEVKSLSPDNNMWVIHEQATQEETRLPRATDTRLQMAVSVLIEVFDEQDRVAESEQTVTENLSRRGAAVWTTLKVERGRFVRVTSAEHGVTLLAAIRSRSVGADGIPRLHLEFVDRQWPLEGID